MTLDEIVTEIVNRKIDFEILEEAVIHKALFWHGQIRAVKIYHGPHYTTVRKVMRERGITIKDIREFKKRQQKLRL